MKVTSLPFAEPHLCWCKTAGKNCSLTDTSGLESHLKPDRLRFNISRISE